MRWPRTSTLVAVALPLGILGLLSFPTHGHYDLFPSDAAMLSYHWPSYSFIYGASLLLLFALARAIFRSLRK